MVNVSNVSDSFSDNVTTADAVVSIATEAQTKRASIFDAVDSNAVIIFTSIGALVIIVLIFGQARAIIATANADDARAIAEAKLVELRETNLRIRNELKLSGLNEEQAKVVKDNSSEIADIVPTVYKLEWSTLVFEARLGSGTFGDCFRGTRAGRPVAIKKMRAGEFVWKTTVQPLSLLVSLQQL